MKNSTYKSNPERFKHLSNEVEILSDKPTNSFAYLNSAEMIELTKNIK